MLGRASGAVLVGVDAYLVDVETHLGGGLPVIATVGLPGAAVREGIDRIRAALPHAGYRLPERKLIVNLAPADVRKQGASLDLPIAHALLVASEQMSPIDPGDTVMVGELALDGSLRPVRGALPFAIAARDAGKRRLILPRGNADEAALVGEIEVLPVTTLADVEALSRRTEVPVHRVAAADLLRESESRRALADLSEVKGQSSARRALEIAAAGGHHLLLQGPPGAGKTMLARRLPGILPPLTVREAVEVTRIWSAAGLARHLVTERPFRAPHHGTSCVGLTGGGPVLRPGEMSLATHGVLYLDEFPEFRRDALEALRQPLEDGEICVVRANASARFPARFTLAASMNPCPCGYLGSPEGRCRCSPLEVRRYLGKLSGPLVDRFDLMVEVPPVELTRLSRAGGGESSSAVRRRVVAARERQRARFGPEGPHCNAGMGPGDLDRHARLGPEVRRFLLEACSRLGFSLRGFDRIRRVSRTIADLAGSPEILPEHAAEAMQYRRSFPLSRPDPTSGFFSKGLQPTDFPRK